MFATCGQWWLICVLWYHLMWVWQRISCHENNKRSLNVMVKCWQLNWTDYEAVLLCDSVHSIHQSTVGWTEILKGSLGGKLIIKTTLGNRWIKYIDKIRVWMNQEAIIIVRVSQATNTSHVFPSERIAVFWGGLAFDFGRFCVVIRVFFIPATTANEGFLYQILSISIFSYLNSWERASTGTIYNVFGMTRSLTGDWTRDLPHSKPVICH